MQINKIYNADCMVAMKEILHDAVDFTLTDIPYEMTIKKESGLRTINKGFANELTFDLIEFVDEVYRITKNSMIIFCGVEQISYIFNHLATKKGTPRPIVWNKTNPSPMNGQHIYLSGIEVGVWFKKANAKVFNAYCKNTIFSYPSGTSKLHPTEKNHALLRELILDNTNEGDIVFDPCCGSGSHLLVARDLHRQFLGFELNADYAKIAQNRVRDLFSETRGIKW